MEETDDALHRMDITRCDFLSLQFRGAGNGDRRWVGADLSGFGLNRAVTNMSRICIILSWAFYRAGELVWHWLAEARPGEHRMWPAAMYLRLMCWSDYWQGDDPRGPCRKPEGNT